jgi:hypothetical protein
MKQSIFFLLFVVVSVNCLAQGASEKSKAFVVDKVMISNESVNFNDPATVERLTGEIMSVVGLQTNFKLKASKKASNIEAVISHRKRFIVYNPEFMVWIQNATEENWAIVFLLTHEIGHHLIGHTLRRTGSKPELELEADEFAGFVLNKLGASLEQAQVVMKYISNSKGSNTHPARVDRLLAIQSGWNKAGIIMAGVSAN